MRKTWLLWISLLILLVEGGVLGEAVKAEELINLGEYSIKAGPTDPSEALSLAWVEAFVYPKNVKEDKIISLGVRTTSLVKGVKAHLDFSSPPVVLKSKDGMAWGGVVSLPADLSLGLHLVRYEIIGKTGTIWRTVEFFVVQKADLAQRNSTVSYGEAVEDGRFPLTVATACSVMVGSKPRLLYPGQKLLGISKLPWYQVQLEDGSKAWISSIYVENPEEELLQEGIKAFQEEKWKQAASQFRKILAINARSAQAYFWLAKVNMKQGLWEEAAGSLLSALEIAPRDINCRRLADRLAQNFLALGKQKLKNADYRLAAVDFKRSLDLKPNSVVAEKGLALCLKKLNLKEETAGVRGISYESLALVRSVKTIKGRDVEAALKLVIALTRSLGTPIIERGWQVRRLGEKFLVSYLCEQGKGEEESFDWMVDVDTRQVFPSNENARLLMSRW
jgi:tetratricopeptide (TPR) repeat protein